MKELIFMVTKYASQYSNEEWDGIVEESRSVQLQVIADKYVVTVPSLNWQIKKRKPEKSIFRYRQFKLNENYFEEITTEGQAYLLGLTASDGFISTCTGQSKPGLFGFNLEHSDASMIEFIQRELETDKPFVLINQENDYGQCTIARLHIYSVKICADIMKYGITERKTGHETMPVALPRHLMSHFIRGYFDGDGTVFLSRGYANIGFTSNELFLDQLQEFLTEEIGLTSKSIYKESGTSNAHRLYYAAMDDVNKLYNYMYGDAQAFLARKRDKLKAMIDEQNARHDAFVRLKEYNTNFVNNVITLRSGAGLKQKDLAQLIGVTVSKMNKMEKSAKIVDMEIAGRIADHFKVNIDDLVFGEIAVKIVSKKEKYDSTLIKGLEPLY